MQDTFNGGYTKALFDVRNYIEQHSTTLKLCRLFNQKGIMKLLDALIDHREELRETGDCVLKYSMDKKEFIVDGDI